MTFNILSGTIPLSDSQYKKFEKKKTEIKFIADKYIGVCRKKRAINPSPTIECGDSVHKQSICIEAEFNLMEYAEKMYLVPQRQLID